MHSRPSLQVGLPGCSVDLSYRLTRYGFGRSLFCTATTQLFPEFMDFHAKWRKDLCEVLEKDPQRHLGQRHFELARLIEEEHTEFPDTAVLATYLLPRTLWSNSGHPPAVKVASCQPDLTTITEFCLQRMGWPVDNLQPRLADAKAGTVIRALLQVGHPLFLTVFAFTSSVPVTR